jgi:hypothetical protein
LPVNIFGQGAKAKVEDQQYSLPPNVVKLSGFLENDIQNSIEHWNKGVVRSGCMFYRHTQDLELRKILDETVGDILTAQRPNGSISCTEVENQPGNKNGDMMERKCTMLAMEEYYDWVNPDTKVLESLKKQADCLIAQIGNPPKTQITELGWSANGIESSTFWHAPKTWTRITISRSQSKPIKSVW